MKRRIAFIFLVFSALTIVNSQEKQSNRFDLGVGTAISSQQFYNHTRDFSFVRTIWKGFGVGIGLNYTELNFKTEAALNNTTPMFFSHSVYIAFTYDYFITPKLEVSPRLALGYCWQMYVKRNDYYRNPFTAYCPAVALQARYWFSERWGAYLGYSYSMPMLFFGEPQSYYDSFYQPRRDFYFNHDLKLGISFRF